MTRDDAPAPKRSDDETEAEIVKRRLIDAVRERLDEIADHEAESDRRSGDRGDRADVRWAPDEGNRIS